MSKFTLADIAYTIGSLAFLLGTIWNVIQR
jgi:hypothetical protein